MKHYLVGGLAVVAMAGGLAAGGLIVTAPTASAGCQYPGGPVISKCDGPVQPDGSWQRCVGVYSYVPNGFSSHLVPVKNCAQMGAGQPAPADDTVADPPMHID